jgi:hypothetical protein
MADMRERVDVDVVMVWNTEGEFIPKEIIWRDGTKFTVDRVLDSCRMASLKAGGMGHRYTVRITNEEYHVFGKVTYLFLDRGKLPECWFVEGKKAANA